MSRHDLSFEVELIVLGGGCAGLSLSAQLLTQMPTMHLVVIEPRAQYEEDRTWCGWRLAPHFFEDCAVAAWHQWRILGRDGTRLLRHSSYPYEMIRADCFYNKACGIVQQSAHASLLLGAKADLVSEEADSVQVHLDDGRVLRSRYVIDTRPRPRVLTSPWLWQNFVGYVVAAGGSETALDDIPTLMDFEEPGSDVARFMYVLPCGEDSFLCEYTSFSRQAGQALLLEQELIAWLNRHAGMGWRLLRRESGSLPMAPPAPSQKQTRIFPAGTRGGSMRISTGYAFHRIQRWAERCAASIRDTGLPLSPARNPFLDTMDELFLRVLQQSSSAADELFCRLFARCPTDPLVRFLSGSPSVRDLWSVADSLPWGRFLRAAASAARMREPR